MSSSLIYDSVTVVKKDSTVTSASEEEGAVNQSELDQSDYNQENNTQSNERRKVASVKNRSKFFNFEGDEKPNEEKIGLWEKLVNTIKKPEGSPDSSNTYIGKNYKAVNSTIAATESGKRMAKTNETVYEKSSDGGSSSGSSSSGSASSGNEASGNVRDIVATNVDSVGSNESEVTSATTNNSSTDSEKKSEEQNSVTNTNKTTDNTTSLNSSTTNSSPQVTSSDTSPPLITLDHSAGSYSSSINVKMSSSESGKVYYCLGQNGCCTPIQWVSNNFNIPPVLVGDEDGNYCLSVMAEDLNGNRSDILRQQYTINSNIPNISVQYSSNLYLQTTEVMQVSITSNKFGRSAYTYWALNIHDNILSNTCTDIVNQYSQSTYGIGFPVSFDSLSLSDQITFNLDKSNLNYGENYIAQIVHNANKSGEASYSCPIQKIVLEDFEFKPSSVIGRMPASNASNITEFQGGVSTFGYFSPTPSTKKSGPGRTLSTDQSLYLESGVVNILN
ncbi:MAG: hypothetical protein U0T83_01650 [Bacteriovoracaceae bacterium]